MDNTRPVRANTADRAPHMLMTHMYVRILVCTVCFQWNIHTNPVHSSDLRVVTTGDGAGGNLKNEKITSCLGSDGKHAPRTHKHCKPCGIHAHDTQVRAHTCLHGLFSVEYSYQPGTSQWILLGVSRIFLNRHKNPKKIQKKEHPNRRRKNNYFWRSIVVQFNCACWDLYKNAIAHYFVWILTTF